MHHEIELGVVIGKNGRDIPESEAESYIAGYSTSTSSKSPFCIGLMEALAMDMTARNVQDAVKKKGLPWSTAKGFDTFSPVG
jgi:acylpyruvate hydrolase